MPVLHSVANIDDPDPRALFAGAVEWVRGGLTKIASAPWAWIQQNGPLSTVTGEDWDDIRGPAGGYFGYAGVVRGNGRAEPYTGVLAEGVEAWAADELAGSIPEQLYLNIYRLDPSGQSYRYEEQDKGFVFSASVWCPDNRPERAFFEYDVSTTDIDSAACDSGSSLSDRWVDQLASVCKIVDVSFASISDDYGTNLGATSLDDVLRRHVPQSAAEARRVLRGYSWVTVVPAELVAKLGGARALSRSGAFYEVRNFPSGSVLLRATREFRDFGQQNVDAVFNALRNVLPSRRPQRPLEDRLEQRMRRLVWKDASQP